MSDTNPYKSPRSDDDSPGAAPKAMLIYWTRSSIPELAALPKSERGRAWRACYFKAFRHWQTWFGLLVCGICAAAGHVIGGEFVTEPAKSSSFRSVEYFADPKLIGAAIGGGIGGFIYSQIAVHQVRPYLRLYLHNAGARTQ
jgi:hypothetical protein